MILGHSQGGGAALFAAEQAGTYAPGLDVIGTAAGAPAGDLESIAGSFGPDGVSGFAAKTIAGFHAAYPELPLAKVVGTPAGEQLIAEVGQQCSGVVAPIDPQEIGAQNPLDDPEWAATIEANTAGGVVPSAPVLIFHGDADATVPIVLTEITLGKYCAIDAPVEVRTYPGADHTSVIIAAIGDIQQFYADRLNGLPATSSC